MTPRRFVLAVVFAFIAGLFTPMAAENIPRDWAPQIRTGAPELQEAIRLGYARSPTFRRLVDIVERSDVVVYLDRRSATPSGTDGCLQYAGTGGGWRFVRMYVRSSLIGDNLIAMLGHELQHAVELAAANDASSAEAVLDLFRRIGEENDKGFDTDAAREAGEQVRAELTR